MKINYSEKKYTKEAYIHKLIESYINDKMTYDEFYLELKSKVKKCDKYLYQAKVQKARNMRDLEKSLGSITLGIILICIGSYSLKNFYDVFVKVDIFPILPIKSYFSIFILGSFILVGFFLFFYGFGNLNFALFKNKLDNILKSLNRK